MGAYLIARWASPSSSRAAMVAHQQREPGRRRKAPNPISNSPTGANPLHHLATLRIGCHLLVPPLLSEPSPEPPWTLAAAMPAGTLLGIIRHQVLRVVVRYLLHFLQHPHPPTLTALDSGGSMMPWLLTLKPAVLHCRTGTTRHPRHGGPGP